ncbi:MAG: spermidine/putrescine ABC transporter substrate-binding protein [Rhodospirillaceae bacterium]|nr:spermidine/putrescine ABC transporter substrate-binding protein [Rhodospirillaceae bacterium]MCY4066971.1 spermidine/putrescine ABC transporter substrate-binding protein [Rhodospirillaceae bacterium]
MTHRMARPSTSSGRSFSRRTFLSGAAGAAAAGALLPQSAQAADRLNVLVWCDHADSKLIKPFERAHNVKVNVKTYEGTGTALSILEQSSPGDWDAIVIDAPDVPRVADMGILDELPDNLAPWDDIFPRLRNASYTRINGKVYAIPEKFGYYGFCYNKDVVDVADVRRGDIGWNKKYKGRIGVYDYYFPVLQMVGISMGLKPQDIKPSHLGDIRKRLLSMRPNVKMIGDIVSIQNALVTKSVDVVVGGAEFTVSNLMPTNPHLDWTISDRGGLIWNQGIGILSKSKRKDLARKFVQWILSPKGQGRLATSECFWAMPANRKAEISDKDKAILRWKEQDDYLARSEFSLLPDSDTDAEMLDIWTEFLQS